MFNFRSLTSLTVLAGLVAASAAQQYAGSEYYLQTKVLSGDSTKGGLYVETYHTGAGESDATLTSNITVAAKGILNGTNQQFELYGTPYPYGFYNPVRVEYTNWQPVEINSGYGDGTFAINGSGLISTNEEWTGWLACDWWHGTPQLFWDFYYKDFPIPSTCARVDLVPVATS